MADASFPTAGATRGRSMLALAAMLLGVLAVYCPPSLVFGDAALYGMDFWTLHLRRLGFAQEQLSATPWTLPGWYPRELLGTPFWSNLQNFPWIPTRLVLLWLDPIAAYGFGVNLAAVLAALFTYLYGRSIGWGQAAAALAGWTFACAGFFAARVMVGHLPLLEAYPALPLLLWLVERALQRPARAPLAALALATACVVVAGHPQLPSYAVAAALLYVLWVGRRGQRLAGVAAIALGVGSTLIVWWPMLQLIGRSTRTLALERAANDLALPYARLGAFFLPWKDGWPSAVQRTPPQSFADFANTSYFWDTVAYVGILPWLAALGLLIALVSGRRAPGRRAVYTAVLGGGALLLALPFAQQLGAALPGTFLRSPARLLYLTGFALSLAVGAGLNAALRASSPRRARSWAVLAGVAVAFHLFDLGSHARAFVRLRPPAMREMPIAERAIAEGLGSGRVAIDWNLSIAMNRRFDDIGVFDSILLARPYRAWLALSGRSPDRNVQTLNGSALSPRVLSSLGVHYVITTRARRDLPLVRSKRYHLYSVPNPVPRAVYFPLGRVQILDEAEMISRLGEEWLHLGEGLMLPPEAAGAEVAAALSPKGGLAPAPSAEIAYSRPSPDRIILEVDVPLSGFIRVLESWDPGWKASIDGVAVPLLRADAFAIAIAVGPGRHRIALEFETPGARAGAAGSALSVLLLAALLWARRR